MPANPHTGALEYICIHQTYELRYWCERLNTTPGQLVTAVHAVGDHVERVRAHLALVAQQPPPPVLDQHLD